MLLELQAGEEKTVAVQGTYVFLKYCESIINVTVELVDGTRASYPLERADQVRFDKEVTHLTLKSNHNATQTIEVLTGYGQFISHTDINGQKLTVEFEDPQEVLVQNQQVPVEIVSGGFDGVIQNDQSNPVPVEIAGSGGGAMPVSFGVDMGSFDPLDPDTWQPSVFAQIMGTMVPLEVAPSGGSMQVVQPPGVVFDVAVKNSSLTHENPYMATIDPSGYASGSGVSVLGNLGEAFKNYRAASATVKGTGGGKIRVRIYQIGGTTTGSASKVTFKNNYGWVANGDEVYIKEVSTVTYKRLLKSFDCEANGIEFTTDEVVMPIVGNVTDHGQYAVLIEVEAEAGVTVTDEKWNIFVAW